MARARLLKPGFFTNEDLCELPMAARLLFAGLWTIADREGRLEDRPKRIKAAVFPYDPEVDVPSLLDGLEARGFIRRYRVDGLALLHISNFDVHQHVHKNEPASTLPEPPPTSSDIVRTPPDISETRPAEAEAEAEAEAKAEAEAEEDARAGAQPEPPRAQVIVADWSEIQAAYELHIGPLLPSAQEKLGAYARQLPKEWVLAAIEDTGKARDPGWPYLDRILARCATTSSPPSSTKRGRAPPGSAKAQMLDRARMRLNPTESAAPSR